MSIEALKKATASSKVLIFAVFAAAITVARHQGWVDHQWWQDTLANAFYLTMGGYSVVEVGRAIWSGKVNPGAALADPKKAMDEAKDGDG